MKLEDFKNGMKARIDKTIDEVLKKQNQDTLTEEEQFIFNFYLRNVAGKSSLTEYSL